jgi:hypothetical protein
MRVYLLPTPLNREPVWAASLKPVQLSAVTATNSGNAREGREVT